MANGANRLFLAKNITRLGCIAATQLDGFATATKGVKCIMPIIPLGKTKCVLCEKPLNEGHEVFGFDGVDESREGKFRKYLDSTVHKECFLNWEDREEYVRAYNEFCRAHFRGFKSMTPDGAIVEHD